MMCVPTIDALLRELIDDWPSHAHSILSCHMHVFSYVVFIGAQLDGLAVHIL